VEDDALIRGLKGAADMYNTILPLDANCAKNAKHTDMTDELTERKQQREHLEEEWGRNERPSGEKEQKTDCTNDVQLQI
jgi:hypothetical protein